METRYRNREHYNSYWYYSRNQRRVGHDPYSPMNYGFLAQRRPSPSSSLNRFPEEIQRVNERVHYGQRVPSCLPQPPKIVTTSDDSFYSGSPIAPRSLQNPLASFSMPRSPVPLRSKPASPLLSDGSEREFILGPSSRPNGYLHIPSSPAFDETIETPRQRSPHTPSKNIQTRINLSPNLERARQRRREGTENPPNLPVDNSAFCNAVRLLELECKLHELEFVLPEPHTLVFNSNVVKPGDLVPNNPETRSLINHEEWLESFRADLEKVDAFGDKVISSRKAKLLKTVDGRKKDIQRIKSKALSDTLRRFRWPGNGVPAQMQPNENSQTLPPLFTNSPSQYTASASIPRFPSSINTPHQNQPESFSDIGTDGKKNTVSDGQRQGTAEWVNTSHLFGEPPSPSHPSSVWSPSSWHSIELSASPQEPMIRHPYDDTLESDYTSSYSSQTSSPSVRYASSF